MRLIFKKALKAYTPMKRGTIVPTVRPAVARACLKLAQVNFLLARAKIKIAVKPSDPASVGVTIPM